MNGQASSRVVALIQSCITLTKTMRDVHEFRSS